MNYFLALLAGTIQGLTEFFPISSSGHLLLFHDIFHFNLPDNLAFDAVLHLGTFGALLFFYWRDVMALAKAFFKSFGAFGRWDYQMRLAWLIIAACVPAALSGYFFEDTITRYFRGSFLTALMLVFFGVILYLADRFARNIRNLDSLSYFEAVVIGCVQTLAFIPGVSRSGITIIAGLNQKLKRPDAARFSFLLALPLTLAAGVKKLLDVGAVDSSTQVTLFLGFAASFIVGYACIRYFIRFLEKHSLRIFAYYRIALGIVVLLLLAYRR